MNQSNLLTVRVAGVMNRQAVVLHAGRTLPCLLSGRLLRQKDSLAVGDRAEAEVLGGGQYRLTRILPRTSALRRPSRRGSGDALLAANADFVLAVCAAPSLLRAFALPEWALEAARAAERSIVDVKTLQHTNEQLISTLDEVMKIQTEGSQKRREAEAELGRIEGELKQKLLELRG